MQRVLPASGRAAPARPHALPSPSVLADHARRGHRPRRDPRLDRRRASAAPGAHDHREHLIGALLILARNERGLTVHEEFDLATVAEDVLDTADLADRRVHTTLEPAVISGDPVLAERLVANLVDNAVRYNAASGDIWISTRTVAGSSQLSVANTGPLISSAE